MTSEAYDIPALRSGLNSWRLHYRPMCRSTNDLAARMRREGRLYAPAVVVTPRQTRGRGRGTNRWSSDSGTLTATFALPVDEAHPPQHLPILAGLAVRDAVAELVEGTMRVQLKWPNDILMDGKKLAGLLCERIENVDLVGVGVNVATNLRKMPADVRDRATSLELIGRAPRLNEVLLAVAKQLHRLTVHRDPFTAVLRRYDAHHYLVGRKIAVSTGEDTPITGTCEGLDTHGRLLVRSTKMLHRIVSGQVTSY